MKKEVYKALQFAQKAHEGQVDKSGAQYFLHPVRVSYRASTDDEKVVALLHDVLEDTHYTVEDIKREVTNNECIIQALELLNHDKSVPYFDYVRKIRDIFYCDWNRQIYLRHVFKAQTKISLGIGFFILAKRKSTSLRCTFFNLTLF